MAGKKRKQVDSGKEQNASSKKAKTSDAPKDALNNGKDFSKLPTEILMMIFEHLKPGEGHLKILAATCTRFNKICSPNFTLQLDFDKIWQQQQYPDISRAYKKIRIIGKDVDSNEEHLTKVFQSSKESAEVLIIGQYDFSPSRVMKLATLVFILKHLANIKSLTIRKFRILRPIIRFEKFDEAQCSELLNLKTLSLDFNIQKGLLAFQKLKTLEKLELFDDSWRKNKGLKKLACVQNNLKSLRYGTTEISMAPNALASVTTFEAPIPFYPMSNQLFLVAPNIENLKLMTDMIGFSTISAILFRDVSSQKLTTIKMEKNVAEGFTIEPILAKFPSLTLFKSKNFTWRKA